MRVAFQEPELIAARSALNVMIQFYDLAMSKEESPAERGVLSGCSIAAAQLLGRFQSIFPDYGNEAAVELSSDESVRLERALRMSAAKCQAMIRPDMSEFMKAAHRESAQEVCDLIARLRQERGLPW